MGEFAASPISEGSRLGLVVVMVVIAMAVAPGPVLFLLFWRDVAEIAMLVVVILARPLVIVDILVVVPDVIVTVVRIVDPVIMAVSARGA